MAVAVTFSAPSFASDEKKDMRDKKKGGYTDRFADEKKDEKKKDEKGK